MKRVNKRSDIPDFESDDEEAAFWGDHELGDDLLEEMGPPPPGLLPEPRRPDHSCHADCPCHTGGKPESDFE